MDKLENENGQGWVPVSTIPHRPACDTPSPRPHIRFRINTRLPLPAASASASHLSMRRHSGKWVLGVAPVAVRGQWTGLQQAYSTSPDHHFLQGAPSPSVTP
mmetsp:Transcript_126997/g.219809  ORF Transcript_126997/g.219809 Transcript_126997/m.219809 type:complete len:102 (-) Transcript_126997:110-415(-)